MVAATQENRAEAAKRGIQTKLLINGKWVDAANGRTFATYNPATEELIAHVAEGDKADIDLAVDAARKAFEAKSWRKMDARDRGRLMYKLADLIERDIDQLAALETLDNGKPFNESRTADLPLVIDCLRYYAGWADKLQGSVVPIRGNNLCYLKREPVGVAGGERFGNKGYFIQPTIFADVHDQMAVATDEIFGPVLSVLKFKDIDEVIARANATEYGLAAAVWTRDIAKAHRVADEVRAGTVWVNCYDVFDAAAPFGGFKRSGIGRELGAKGLDNYLEEKTVTIALG